MDNRVDIHILCTNINFHHWTLSANMIYKIWSQCSLLWMKYSLITYPATQAYIRYAHAIYICGCSYACEILNVMNIFHTFHHISYHHPKTVVFSVHWTIIIEFELSCDIMWSLHQSQSVFIIYEVIYILHLFTILLDIPFRLHFLHTFISFRFWIGQFLSLFFYWSLLENK